MRIGRMRHRLELQVRSDLQESNGEFVDQWMQIATIWASVNQSRGSSLIQERAFQHEVPVTITVRYRSDISPEMQFVDRCENSGCNGQIYEVQGVSDLEGRRDYQLIAARKLTQLSGVEL